MVVKDLFNFFGLFDDFGGRHVVHIRHGVVIVKLDAVEPDRFVDFKLFAERNRLTDFRTERVGSFVNVPGTE